MARPAMAQTRYQAYRKEVLKLFREGRALASKKSYKGSLVKLRAAYNLLDEMGRTVRTTQQKQTVRRYRIRFLFFIGRVAELDGDLEGAVSYYRACVRQDPTSKAAKVTLKRLTSLMPRIETSLQIKTTPSGARIVLVDPLGKKLTNRTPATFRLLPGPIKFKLIRKGYVTEIRRLKLKIKQRKKILITLLKPPPQWQIVAWVSVSVAVLSAAAGTALMLVTEERVSNIEQRIKTTRTTSPQLFNDYEAAQTLEGLGIAAFSLGGLAIGLAITGFVLAAAPPPPRKDVITRRPSPSPGQRLLHATVP